MWASVSSFLRRATGQKMANDLEENTIPAQLRWVKDAPMFIDERGIADFYDAVLRPPYKEDSPVKISFSSQSKYQLSTKGGLEGKISIPDWISFLKGEFKGHTEIGTNSSDSKSSQDEIELYPVVTPHRQLEQLTAYYSLVLKNRIFFGNNSSPMKWQLEKKAQISPRALVFIDFDQDIKFVPMAAELSNGKIETFFDQMRDKDGRGPPYFSKNSKSEYWKWMDDNFNPDQSMKLIENFVSRENSRIEWIDYRVPLESGQSTMHVSISAYGKYNVGTFSYRMIRRPLGHGIRIVGTLKDGPDINVLAIYEK